jgi:hypothetical protein
MIEINNTNALIIKSFEFAIDVVNLARYLQTEKNEYVISKQVLRSGTSIGANFTLLNCCIFRFIRTLIPITSGHFFDVCFSID